MSMFLCNQKDCNQDFSDVSKLMGHLKKTHYIFQNPYLKIHCLCEKTYVTIDGYKKHVKICSQAKRQILFERLEETENINNQNGVIIADNNVNDSNLLQIDNSLIEDNSFSDPGPDDLTSKTEDFIDLKKEVYDFSTDLYTLKLPVTTINFIMGKIRDLSKIHTKELEKLIEKKYPNLNVDIKTDVLDQADKLHQNFQKFDSQYKREKFLKEICTLPTVQEIPIDVVQEQPSTLKHQLTKTRTFTYISVIETLTFLLENKSFKEFFFRPYYSEENVIQDIQDGEYFKYHALFGRKNERHFIIQLYFDEFDTCNPLQPKKGIYNLGAIYFSLRNLPPFLNSCINNLYLVTLFHADDLKNHQFSDILRPLISDLKKLEQLGIKIDDSDCKQKEVKGTIGAMSFDNLGGNSLLSLVKCFSGTYFCKICKIAPENIQKHFVEDPGLMRTKEDLKKTLELLSQSNSKDSCFGVKDRCVLNDLEYFHSCECYSVDIMHDLFEGVVPYEMKIIVGFLISKNVFSLDDLNKKILSFKYGIVDRCNKPVPFTMNKDGISISSNSAQMICLSMYLPLMIGHLIPPEYFNHWNVFLILLRIIDIVMSFKFKKSMVKELQDLVKEHHTLFLECFPESHLIPKHHFMVHYGTVMLKMGPLRYLWCMRFEAKHKYFKELTRRTMPFNNICKSLSNRHQKDVMYQTYVKNFNVKFTYSRFYRKKISSIPKTFENFNFSQIISQNLGVDRNSIIKTIKWLKMNSVEYRKDFFLFHGIDVINNHSFLRIELIFIHEDEFYALGEVFVSDYFCEELHSFSLISTNEFSVVLIKNLPHIFPFEKHLNEAHESEIFITPGVILF